MKNSIKSALYILSIGLLALSISSCSRGYGCPYNSSIEMTEDNKSSTIVFINEADTVEEIEPIAD